MSNRYCKSSRLSEAQFRELNRLFAMDLEATKIASLLGFHRTTIDRYLLAIRARIAEELPGPPKLVPHFVSDFPASTTEHHP